MGLVTRTVLVAVTASMAAAAVVITVVEPRPAAPVPDVTASMRTAPTTTAVTSDVLEVARPECGAATIAVVVRGGVEQLSEVEQRLDPIVDGWAGRVDVETPGCGLQLADCVVLPQFGQGCHVGLVAVGPFASIDAAQAEVPVIDQTVESVDGVVAVVVWPYGTEAVAAMTGPATGDGRDRTAELPSNADDEEDQD